MRYEKIEEKIWEIVDELCKLFWILYFKGKIEEWQWRQILKEADFDWLEQEVEDGYYEITEIGTMISEDKALIINREGWVVIIVKDPYESIFTGWANREPLTWEETATALIKMMKLINIANKYIYGA